MRYAVKATPALISAIIKYTLPEGWTVHFRRDQDGMCIRGKREIHVPKLKHGYHTMWVYFHELGHALRVIEGKFRAAPVGCRVKGRMSSSYEEWTAEHHAIDMMANFGFPITAAELQSSRENVRQYIRAEKRAGQPIYVAVEKFAYPKPRSRA